MKIVQVNAVCGIGSTGMIVQEISNILTQNNIENYVLHTGKQVHLESSISYATNFAIKYNALLAKILGNYGFNSVFETARLIKKLEQIKPDIVHLHNIHGHNLNLKTFFTYLKKNKIRVIWTFHDCWAFTGYCTHFEQLPCNKWETQCHNCPQRAQFSWFFDRSEGQYLRKKELFCAIPDLTIVTPSKWLANLVKKSFLKDFEVKVINNGIDLDVFRYQTQCENKMSDDRFVVLGIPKGNIDPFLQLNDLLDKGKYKLVLAGLTEEELQVLPSDIVGVKRTNDKKTLSLIYSSADVFVNLTLQDTFPTVNLEALACKTPVITYNTGGSPETIDEHTGIVVAQKDIVGVYKAIEEISNGPDKGDACAQRAKTLYNAKQRFADYLALYTNKYM